MDKYSERKPFIVCCSAEAIEQSRYRFWASALHNFSVKPLLGAVITEMVEGYPPPMSIHETKQISEHPSRQT